MAQLPYPTSNCLDQNVDTGGPVSRWPSALSNKCDQAWNPDTTELVVIFAEALCRTFGPDSGACNGFELPAPGEGRSAAHPPRARNA